MIIRTHKTSNFTVISNAVINDSRLSFRARGVLIFLLSKPDTWRAKTDHLAGEGKEGRDAIRAALGELEALGYLVRELDRDDKGRVCTITHIFESPQIVEKPETENQASVNQSPVGQSPVGQSPVNQAPYKELIESTDQKELIESTDSIAPASGAQPNSTTVAIYEAYRDALGYHPVNVPAEMKFAKILAGRGIQPADVTAAYHLLKAQWFWQNKHLPLAIVAREMPALAQHIQKGGDADPQNKLARSANAIRQVFSIVEGADSDQATEYGTEFDRSP